MVDVRSSLTYPMWERYSVLSHEILRLDAATRRQLLAVARDCLDPDVLLPAHGFTVGELAVWTAIGERKPRKPHRRRNASE